MGGGQVESVCLVTENAGREGLRGVRGHSKERHPRQVAQLQTSYGEPPGIARGQCRLAFQHMAGTPAESSHTLCLELD